MVFDSKALRVNLEETAVRDLHIDPRYEVLREAVADYRGILNTLDHLLFELHHPFRNWNVLLDEFRSFALKHFAAYARTPRGPEALATLLGIFLDAVETAPKAEHQALAAQNLLALVEKAAQALEPGEIGPFLPVIRDGIHRLAEAPEPVLLACARSHYPFPRTARTLVEKVREAAPDPGEARQLWQACGALLLELRRVNWQGWLAEDDPVAWLRETAARQRPPLDPAFTDRLVERFRPVSHERLRALLRELADFDGRPLDEAEILALAAFPGHRDIVEAYRDIARDLTGSACSLVGPSGEGGICLLMLFHMAETEGLANIREEILREINRSLICMVRTADPGEIEGILKKSFALLRHQEGRYLRTSLQCIEALGIEVLKRRDPRLTEVFLDETIRFGFTPPGIEGVDREWHVLSNPAHLQNIRVWLSLVEADPAECSRLLSALLINLRLAGTCIKDTDLFQRDVSRLLNSPIAPVYNLVKQVARTFPVYFNEIGAEGLLRDVSTEVDELAGRRDPLVHFLRKQSHVESNNLIVAFIEAILCFWYGREKKWLAPFVPPEVLEEIRPYGPHTDHAHRLVRHLAEELGLEPFAAHLDQLLDVPEDRLEALLAEVPDVPPGERRRVALLVRMYRLETLKYKLGVQEIRHHLEQAKLLGFEGLDEVLEVLDADDPAEVLEVILSRLEELKAVILSPERFEAREDIYHKRHIAADIPSMYGRYHERKFDALSLSLRLENLANLYFERLISESGLPYVSRAHLPRTLQCLRLFRRALKVDGLKSRKFDAHLNLLERSLEVENFTYAQYLDVVRGLVDGVKSLIHASYIRPHRENLALSIRLLGPENLLPKFRGPEPGVSEAEWIQQTSERFLRELIAGTFGLQHLDNFVTRLHHSLSEQGQALEAGHRDLLLRYDPDRLLSPIHRPARKTHNVIHLGNKGYNLTLLAGFGLPVPPGIIVTTDLYRYHSLIEGMPELAREFSARLRQAVADIEDETGRRFGDPSNPLLVSVRSGAAISMPGMMTTVLNVGSTLETIRGLERRTGKTWFAWDNYRRFLQSWGMSFGLERDIFTHLMKTHKERHGVAQKREFTGAQMKELALAYRQALLDHGIDLVEDPHRQLLTAVRLVLDSWTSRKAKAYREIMGISDDWGTAVIIQAMTFGNLSAQSGTGVVFTTDPHNKGHRLRLWGDYTPGNQGEDIVSGLVSTFPISRGQREALGFEEPNSLEEAFPEIYGALLTHVRALVEGRKWAHQEIEFTFEGPRAGDLYILQTRDMIAKKETPPRVFKKTRALAGGFLARGIGASGGALAGRAVFSLEEIQAYRARHPRTPLILIRSDTVPDDIREISLADGLLTAKGGQTSHAAIVASSLGKTCVVGCKALQVFDGRGFARIRGHVIRPGDPVSIDGHNGSVYKGIQKTQAGGAAAFQDPAAHGKGTPTRQRKETTHDQD
ncbi:phosphoenolpyruvate synthase [Dissulfurirhabdus thermomarina]|uniref:Phosphoenolpyruvate synthase n=1 Tax=Dissulfurirhabdus thermomarina TaxID=1765737 RepID=A0A6N9TTB6_DISTH|nr:PEP/pyruvate-binding domain-containing protein [Dissulfurirhabdus thermomarina]NDY41736.1 phosphoenolpyruvate synthase [Dissulfurirhabdus thermomarina]NMX23672.1 phosphoenolpyruvate synthase [Dissulfurirhabdus thermomarina]